MMTRPVFLDACVLYPTVMRELLTGAAAEGIYRPLWSERVLGEWRIAAARKQGPAAGAAAEAAQATLAARFPHAEIAPPAEAEAAIALPDPNDTHVLAAAIAGSAGTLVTLNLRDFPGRRLAAHAITPRHPDGFLWELASQAPDILARLVQDATGSDVADAQRRALKRAGLPRLGKAMATG